MLRWLRRLLRPAPPPYEHLPEFLLATLQTLSRRFKENAIAHAVIGGVAVSLHGPPRVTVDLDFLIPGEAADAAHRILLEAGFESAQRTRIFGNYALGSLHVDLLYAGAGQSRQMLDRAVPMALHTETVNVARPEDLVGLKLQALANAPDRKNDWPDVVQLLERFNDTMDMTLVRDYFMLFEREHDLDQILATVRSKRS